jgi:tetratricopeptide (TPR) repeat protein
MHRLLRQILHHVPAYLVAILLAAAGVQGARAAPELHGKHFLALEEAALVVPVGSDGAEAVGLNAPDADAIERLQQRLEEQRLADGPYAPGAAETLSDLARILEMRGQLAQALARREEALHLIRVNEGLYSAAQGPVLRAMLDSLRAARDFEALDQRYAYYYRLYGAGRPPFNELRWAATMEYFDWQREALRRELDGDPRERLLELHATQAELLATVAEDPAFDWRWLLDLTRSQLATLYIVEDLVQPEIQLLRRSQVTRVRGDELRDFDPLRERLENLQRLARAQGRMLVEAALQRVPDAEVAARAGLRLDLADWLQWHGSTRSAREMYDTVWQELEAAGRDDLLEQWFARPQPLPRGTFLAPLDRLRSNALRVRIDVSAYGRVQVGSDGVPEERASEFSTLRRLLRASRFRPAFRNGEPIDVRDLATSWLLVDD